MSDVLPSPIARCPPELIARAWEFLDECSLARCEAVCTGWRAQIASPDQHVWQTFCRITNGSDFPSCEELSSELKVFDSRTVELIFGYAENYKGLAEIIHGMVVLDNDLVYMHTPQKDGSRNAEWPWGRSEIEPYIGIKIFREKSAELAMKKGDVGALERGTWDAFFHIQQHVCCYVPIRLFYNRDGSLKNHGDKLRVLINGKRVQLKCVFNEYMRTCGLKRLHDYAEAITFRVDISLPTRMISPNAISSAAAAAMADPREWIPSEES